MRRITREYEMKIDELRASLTKESIRSEQARTLVGSRAVDRAPASLRIDLLCVDGVRVAFGLVASSAQAYGALQGRV